MFLLVSVLAGLLVAGLTIPVAAVAGVASNVVSESMTDLPVDLEAKPPAEPTEIFLADGSRLAQLYDEYRVPVKLDQIAAIMQKAQVAIEDNRFYEHGALDLKSLAKAALGYFTSDGGGGGSTLTQQYVKQVLIENAVTNTQLTEAEREKAIEAAQARTLSRKIAEMKYAIAVEKKLSKDQILENYLNIAYYGDHVYGVEAAAHHYFNTTAANLTLAQAAMLAGLVQTPGRNPVDDLPGAIDRRDTVLDRMQELGIITADESAAAQAEGFDATLVQEQLSGCANVQDYAYKQICEYTMTKLGQNENLGSDKESVMANLRLGGYTINTTIDPSKQHAAQDALSAQIPAGAPVKSSMAMMQPGTGYILAAVQNRTEIPSGSDDDATQLAQGKTAYQYFAPEADGGAGAQGGSTFKPFVVAAALGAGIPPSKTFVSPAKKTFPKGMDFKGCTPDQPILVTEAGGWPVTNSPAFSSTPDMYKGAANSVNTYFVQLEQMVGVCAAVNMAALTGANLDPALGVVGVDGSYMAPSFTLGVATVSPLQMATVYSTFAARGVRCDPIIVASIKDRDGVDVPTPTGNCQQVIRPEVADGVNAVLNNAFTTGTASGYNLADRRDVSGKTGTTDDGQSAWVVGYTPNIVGIVNVSYDSSPVLIDFWRARGFSMSGLDLGNGNILNGFGAADSGPIWKAAMDVAVQSVPADKFTKPSAEIINGKKTTPPSFAGMGASQAKQTAEAAGFSVVEKKVYDESPAGTYLSTTCQAVYGGTCTQLFSQGPRPEDPKPPTPSDSASTAGLQNEPGQ
jgi:membrane peptidoglycan carboxypeptidase